MVLGEVQAENAIFRRRQKAVTEPLPPGHTGLGRVEAQPARAQDDVPFSAFDDTAQVGDDRRIVLTVRVQHDDDVGAHGQSLLVASLLVAAVAEVAAMANHVETQRSGDAYGCIGACIVDKEDAVGVALGDVADDLDESLCRAIGGQDDNPPWPRSTPVQLAEWNRVGPDRHPLNRQVAGDRERTDRGRPEVDGEREVDRGVGEKEDGDRDVRPAQ